MSLIGSNIKNVLNDIKINTDAKNHRANIGWSVECRNGDIPGATMSSLVARNAQTDNNERVLFPFDVADVGLNDVTEIATARILSFASSDAADDNATGQGLQILLRNGVYANYVQQTENITMAGLTEVDSMNTYIAINQMFSLVVGTTGHNVGNIYCSDATDTFTLGVPQTRNYHVMEKEWNLSFTGIYTVPAGHTWFPCKYSSITDAVSGKEVVSQIDARLAEGLPIFRLNEFTNAGIAFDYDLNGVVPVGEKGVWILRARQLGTGDVKILVYVQSALINNAIYNV